MAPIWPHTVGIASTRIAAATATLARSRSGTSERIMPSTACATTATAATFSPCSQPAPPPPNACTPYANITIATAEGSVKPVHAASAPR
jgi:hypothetical protein